MGNADRTTYGSGELILVINGFSNRDGCDDAVDKRLLSCSRCGEPPGVEDGIAHKVGDCTVVLVCAGLHLVVHRTRALIFHGLTTGESADLANTLERNEIEDWPVITYLTDGRQWNTVEVDLFHTACGPGEKRRPGARLRTWQVVRE